MPIGINQGYQITGSNALGEALAIDLIVRGISLQRNIKHISLEVRGHPELDRLVLTAQALKKLGYGVSVSVINDDPNKTSEVELSFMMPANYWILRRDYQPQQ